MNAKILAGCTIISLLTASAPARAGSHDTACWVAGGLVAGAIVGSAIAAAAGGPCVYTAPAAPCVTFGPPPPVVVQVPPPSYAYVVRRQPIVVAGSPVIVMPPTGAAPGPRVIYGPSVVVPSRPHYRPRPGIHLGFAVGW